MKDKATLLRKRAKPATASVETRIIIMPLDAYWSEKNAEVKDTGGMRSEYALARRALKTLTNEPSR